MSDLLLTLFIAVLLPYLAKLPLVVAMHRAGGYDNHYPRRQQSSLTDFGQRCNAAHYNSFEALLVFATACIFVIAVGTVSQAMLVASWAFIVCRLGYLVCYWLDWATARSLIWLGSMAAAISIMLMALQQLN